MNQIPELLTVPSQTSFNLVLKYHRWSIMAGLLLTAGISIVLILFYSRIQPVVPMMYSLPDTASALVPKWWLGYFPVMSWAMLLGHLAILRLIKNQAAVLRTMFMWSTTLVIGLLALSFLRIIWITW